MVTDVGSHSWGGGVVSTLVAVAHAFLASVLTAATAILWQNSQRAELLLRRFNSQRKVSTATPVNNGASYWG